jgi:hypothetical protein
MGLGSGMAHRIKEAEQDEEEEWDDFQRYKDNRADFTHSKFLLYYRKDFEEIRQPERKPPQMVVYLESRPMAITDPVSYENEFKRRNVWSVRDIESFL